MKKELGEKAKRNQWQNLMNFNAKKNKKDIGEAEVHKAADVTEKDENFTRVNKSSPVK